MRIIYLLNTCPKISESFVLNEIVELLKKGHDIQILSIHSPMEDLMHDEVNEYNLLERTHYFRCSYIFKGNYFNFIKYLFKFSIDDVINLKIHVSRLIINLKLAYFATIIDMDDIDFIHVHFANMGGIARRLGKIMGVPYTLTAHAYDIYQNPDADELRIVMEDAKSVVTISEYNKKYLSKEICFSNTIEVIRCGINLNKFNPQRKSDVSDRIKILTVARLVEKKGIEYMIKAIPRVIKEVSDCEFTIVGSGPLNDCLHQLVHDLDLGGYVQFKGDVSDSELMQCYEDTDIFILPCIIGENGDRDGIPVAMMEAMAMGLPVISTIVSGIPELVEDGVSGLLVPPCDEKSIAEAVVALSKNRELRGIMGEIGRKIIEKKYNIMIEAEKLSDLFQQTEKH
jgi:glycosyltransferase involved in cell wall biosynthesis